MPGTTCVPSFHDLSRHLEASLVLPPWHGGERDCCCLRTRGTSATRFVVGVISAMVEKELGKMYLGFDSLKSRLPERATGVKHEGASTCTVQQPYTCREPFIDVIYFPFSFPILHSWQVLHQKQVDSPVVKQVSVRRFATFDLFTRSRVMPSCPSDDQWVQYRSVSLPEYSALLRCVTMDPCACMHACARTIEGNLLLCFEVLQKPCVPR